MEQIPPQYLRSNGLVEKLSDNIYIGDLKGATMPELMKDMDIIINLSCFRYPELEGKTYIHLDVPDSPDYNISQHFDELLDIIHDGILENKRIFVHCVAGISRSATIVLAYMIKKTRTSLDNCMMFMTMFRRQRTAPNPGFMSQLRELEKTVKIDED